MKTTSRNQTARHGACRRSAPPSARGSAPRPAAPALVAHVLNTLPDSLSRREEVLKALAGSIPAGEESGVVVRLLQFHLEEHQRLRLEGAGPADQA
jgi:hypothetical protein